MHANQPDRNHDPIELTEGLEDLSLDDDDLDDDDDDDVDGEPGTRRRRRRLRDLLKPQPRKKLSEILQDLMIDPARDTISVGDLLREMDARAFGALLLVFAFPNVLSGTTGACWYSWAAADLSVIAIDAGANALVARFYRQSIPYAQIVFVARFKSHTVAGAGRTDVDPAADLSGQPFHGKAAWGCVPFPVIDSGAANPFRQHASGHRNLCHRPWDSGA